MKKVILAIVFFIIGVSMSFADEKFILKSNTIKDNAFISNEQVYNGYGCKGENISPDLSWSNTPSNTKGYAIIMHDPDAPTPGGWYHWVVVNIPASKTNLKKGEVIAAPAISCKTSFKTESYGGPCPPIGHGRHRYIFTVFALDAPKLSVEPGLAPDKVESIIKQHVLASASITAYYERK